MNLIKTVKGNDLLEIEEKVNEHLRIYEGELIQFQVIKDDANNKYEAVISYKQSIPNSK